MRQTFFSPGQNCLKTKFSPTHHYSSETPVVFTRYILYFYIWNLNEYDLLIILTLHVAFLSTFHWKLTSIHINHFRVIYIFFFITSFIININILSSPSTVSILVFSSSVSSTSTMLSVKYTKFMSDKSQNVQNGTCIFCILPSLQFLWVTRRVIVALTVA